LGPVAKKIETRANLVLHASEVVQVLRLGDDCGLEGWSMSMF
jgi:hypothetical protein